MATTNAKERKPAASQGRDVKDAAACCRPEAKASCCEPSEKAECCGTTETTGRCGCR